MAKKRKSEQVIQVDLSGAKTGKAVTVPRGDLSDDAWLSIVRKLVKTGKVQQDELAEEIQAELEAQDAPPDPAVGGALEVKQLPVTDVLRRPDPSSGEVVVKQLPITDLMRQRSPEAVALDREALQVNGRPAGFTKNGLVYLDDGSEVDVPAFKVPRSEGDTRWERFKTGAQVLKEKVLGNGEPRFRQLIHDKERNVFIDAETGEVQPPAKLPSGGVQVAEDSSKSLADKVQKNPQVQMLSEGEEVRPPPRTRSEDEPFVGNARPSPGAGVQTAYSDDRALAEQISSQPEPQASFSPEASYSSSQPGPVTVDTQPGPVTAGSARSGVLGALEHVAYGTPPLSGARLMNQVADAAAADYDRLLPPNHQVQDARAAARMQQLPPGQPGQVITRTPPPAPPVNDQLAKLQLLMQQGGGGESIPDVMGPMMKRMDAAAAQQKTAAEGQYQSALKKSELQAKSYAALEQQQMSEAAARQKDIEQMEQRAQQHEQVVRGLSEEMNKTAQINPNRLWQDMSTGGKLVAVASMLGGVFAGAKLMSLGYGDGTNRAKKAFDDLVKADVDAQIRNADMRDRKLQAQLNTQQNLYRDLRQAGMDSYEARKQAEMMTREAMATELQRGLSVLAGDGGLRADHQALLAQIGQDNIKAQVPLAAHQQTRLIEQAQLRQAASQQKMALLMQQLKGDKTDDIKDAALQNLAEAEASAKNLVDWHKQLESEYGGLEGFVRGSLASTKPGAVVEKELTGSASTRQLATKLFTGLRQFVTQREKSAIQKHDWDVYKALIPNDPGDIGAADNVKAFMELAYQDLNSDIAVFKGAGRQVPQSLVNTRDYLGRYLGRGRQK